jgi:hypothetical protein
LRPARAVDFGRGDAGRSKSFHRRAAG